MTITLVVKGYFSDLEVKLTKKFNFQSYLLSSNYISATDSLWKFSWNHHSYGCILIYGQSWYVWRKMLPLMVIAVTIFLSDIPHLNDQQNITELFWDYRQYKKRTCWAPWSPYKILKMATCYGSSFKLEIAWGTTGTFCVFLRVKYSDVSMAIEFICKGVMR